MPCIGSSALSSLAEAGKSVHDGVIRSGLLQGLSAEVSVATNSRNGNKGGKAMREKITRIVSDWSGEPIPEKEAWQLSLRAPDGRTGLFVADLTEQEANELKARGGEQQRRRGRAPKGAA